MSDQRVATRTDTRAAISAGEADAIVRRALFAPDPDPEPEPVPEPPEEPAVVEGEFKVADGEGADGEGVDGDVNSALVLWD
jgi:hypothetical protein